MSVVVQGIVTELMSVIERVGKLDDSEETRKAFLDAVCSVDISSSDMQTGIIRVTSIFKVQEYEVDSNAN